MPISAKSLRPEEQERVRAALIELRERCDNQAQLARMLSVKQQTISRVLKDGTIGVKLAQVVAQTRKQSLEELLSGAPKPRSYGELPGWDEAAKEVIAERRAPPYAVRAVSAWPVMLHVTAVEPRLIIDLAALWIQWSPLAVRAAAESEQAREDLAAREAEHKRASSATKAARRRIGQKTS